MDLSLVDKITKNQLRNDIPEFKSGDTVKVHVRIKEGNKTRIQIFEGVVVDRSNGGIGATFTVRKISSGVGASRQSAIKEIPGRIKNMLLGGCWCSDIYSFSCRCEIY